MNNKNSYKIWNIIRDSGLTDTLGWEGLLHQTSLSPDQIDEVSEVADEEVQAVKEAEKYYYEKVRPETMKAIGELIAETDKEFIKKARLEYIKTETEELKEELAKHLKDYERMDKANMPYYLLELMGEPVEEVKKKMNSLNAERHAIENNNDNGITREQIARAKEYPMERLVSANKAQIALCPFHEDTNPSMSIKNNFYYCFTCQETGDAIDLVMKTKNLTFKEAVLFLT